MRFSKYIFICTNERAEGHPRGSCGTRGSLEILEAFKQEVKELGLQAEVRVNKSGCMECCEIGPAILVHPDNVWYQHVALEDVKEIVSSHIRDGKPVERLKANFSRYNRLLGL